MKIVGDGARDEEDQTGKLRVLRVGKDECLLCFSKRVPNIISAAQRTQCTECGVICTCPNCEVPMSFPHFLHVSNEAQN